MQLANGARLGHYEVIAALGRGGMGEVYRARDTRLNRDVAIKLLPANVAANPERIARFRREAQLLAALSHPHIAHVYGIEESGETRALVMELVEGIDLRQRLERGRMRRDEAIAIAIQIAAALEAAHDKGIIHRDLKPANIMLDADGRAKVLDFGLAKSNQQADDFGSADSPTLTSPAHVTQHGAIVGTAAYMSPEQATGRVPDKRSDIWSFGCVLFEMLSGRRAFEQQDVPATIEAILATAPDIQAIDHETPAMRRLVRRCLEKDRKRRFADFGDVRVDLEDLAAGGAEVAASRPAPRRAATIALASVAATAIVAAMGVAVWRPWSAPPAVPALRAEIDLGAAVSLVTAQGNGAVLSPDGTTLIFVGQARTAGSVQELYMRRLDSLTATLLQGTGGAMAPFFSSDGQWVGFFAGAKLKKIALAGGGAIDVADAPNGRGGSWGDDDHIVYMPDFYSGLWRVSASGGTPVQLTSPAAQSGTHRWPQVLPGSKAVIYTSHTILTGYEDADLVLQPIPAGTPVIIQKGAYFGRVLATGHLVYMHEGTLFAAPFDLNGQRLTRAGVPVLEDVSNGAFWTGAAQFTASDTGLLACISERSSATPVSWLDDGGATSILRPAASTWSDPKFSKDGSLLAMTIFDGRRSDVWLYDWGKDALSRLTLHQYSAFKPVWSPDGSRVAFTVARGDLGVFNIAWQRADGSGEIQRLTQGANGQAAGSFHPSGRYLALNELDAKTSFDIKVMPIDGDEASGWQPGQPTDFVKSPAVELEPMFSPDGRFIAYASNESGRFEVYVRPFPGPGGVWQVSREGGAFPAWSPAGSRLYYATLDQRLMSVDYAADSRSFRAGQPRVWAQARHRLLGPLIARNYDVHPDGRRAVVSLAPDERAAGDRIVVISNFLDELRQRVPR